MRPAQPQNAAEEPPISGLARGAILWIGFGAALVFLRGIRWDEDYEFAQILAGRIEYPAWHPLRAWVHSLHTAQLHLMTLLVHWFPGPAVPNAVRNLLFIWATVLPPYLIGAALARRALAGHVAAALVLIGVHTAFDGSYPQFTTPGMFSNGHVGTGFALAAIAALALGRVATGFFLIGLMPWVHIGQTPPLFLFLAVVFLSRMRNPAPGAWRKPDIALAAGLAISAVCWSLSLYLYRDSGYAPAATASSGDARAIWNGWVTYHDMHRQRPGLNSLIMTVGFVFLGYVAVFGKGLGKGAPSRAWIVAFVYGAVALLIVLFVVLTHLLLGSHTPSILLTWLPYRLWNHVPPIFVALVCATLLRPREEPDRARATAGYAAVVAALLFLLVRPGMMAVLPAPFSYRYFGSTDFVLFFLFGAAAVVELSEARSRSPRVFAAFAGVGVFAILMLALVHQFGTFAVIAGIATAAALLIRRLPERIDANAARMTLALLALALTGLTIGEFRRREWLPVAAFEREIARHLESEGQSGAMLLVPLGQVQMQARTGHPVMVDLATPFHFGYRPILAPAINEMYGDLYGVDFRFPATAQPWQKSWAERTEAEWQSLATRYDFRYIVAPRDLRLKLPEEVSGSGRVMYRVPE